MKPTETIGKDEIIHNFVDGYFIEEGKPVKKYLFEVERMIIVFGLQKTGGNQKVAASLLGVKETTLSAKIKRLGIRMRKQPYITSD